MKIEIDGVLLCGIQQVEQGERHASPGVSQAQACQPERGKRPTCHDKHLENQQGFWVRPDQVKQGDGEQHRLEMDRKARNAIQSITVRIGKHIADRLVKECTMPQAPEGLVHDAQVLTVRFKRVLLRCQEQTEVDDVCENRKCHQAKCDPERARARQRLWFAVEPLEPGQVQPFLDVFHVLVFPIEFLLKIDQKSKKSKILTPTKCYEALAHARSKDCSVCSIKKDENCFLL